MFKSVLIANRGEIACRVARTARRMGLRVIAVYSEADRNALHVRGADEAHLIGPAPAAQSYLNAAKIIEVARAAEAECIHPGYGFLSENAGFAEACADAGIVFVGPSPDAIRAMGLKDRAKALMEQAGVPVVPGYHGERQSPDFLREKAYEIGYPVLIKAVAGGGGKGMRRVDLHAEFESALEGASREAQAAFGDPRVLIEKYVVAPRHIEMQVFADKHGNAIHLNERDCSLQRRHQKVIEEAPAPGMTSELRAAMGQAAVAAAKAVNYSSAGTVEFIVDGSNLRAGGFWFMEMNTRLQVEHPVTEAITGLDLVDLQFRIAAGEPLPLRQDDVKLIGHAVEARVYAEDPARGFLPSTGKLVALDFPSSVRVDTGVETGAEVSPFYDPMIAKLIAHGSSREAALDQLATALEQSIVVGPRSNVAFLAALCRTRDFRAGKFDTGFIDRHLAGLTAQAQGPDHAAIALGAVKLLEQDRARLKKTGSDPWDATDSFQLGGERTTRLALAADGEPVVATLTGDAITVEGQSPASGAIAIAAEDGIYVVHQGRQTKVTRPDFEAAAAHGEGSGLVRAPMHGKVLAVFVDEGDAVHRGQRLAILEAMKMEHTLAAPFDGTVTKVAVVPNAQVAEGATIMTIEEGHG